MVLDPFLVYGPISGKLARVQAWRLKRLVSVFNRVAKRGHFPRERAIQRIYTSADIPLPTDPRYLFSEYGYGWVCEP